MDESSMTQNRRSRRSNLLMAASVETADGTIGVTLRNLSADGALVEGAGLTEAGSAVVFRKKDLVISGRVAWIHEHRAGIAFDAQLEPETVLRHVPTPKNRFEQTFRRPGFSSHALTPEERRWCETLVWDGPAPSLER